MCDRSRNEKGGINPPETNVFLKTKLALTRLEARVLFVDNINTTAATYYTVSAVAALQGLE